VTVRNAQTQVQGGAVCKLFDPTWSYLGGTYPDKTTNSSGVCTWTGLPSGNYRVQVYYPGVSPLPDTEYWGWTPEETVAPGPPTTAAFQRMLPYATNVELRLGSASGTLLGPSSVVNLGQTVWVGVTVTQTSGASQSARVRAVLDTDRVAPYDWDQYLTPNPDTVPTGGRGCSRAQ
jgi:hypothetical protein